MILLITGEDAFRKNARMNEIIKSGEKLYGTINIINFEERITFGELSAEINSIPFLSEKRLLIGKNILASKNSELLEKLTSALKNVPETTDIIFFENEAVDQRKALFKGIKQYGEIEVFEPLKQFELINWIKKEVSKLNGCIDENSAQVLFQYCGNNLFRLENEIKKLLNFNNTINKESIEKLVNPEYSNSIFELMDAISDKKSGKAVIILNRFFENNENELYISSMLARQIKNLLLVKSLRENNFSESDIVKTTKLHPFVVKKTLQQSRSFTMEELKNLHKRLLELDFKLKTDSVDPKIILTNFIFKVMNK